MPFLGAKVGLYKGYYVFQLNPERIHGSMTAVQRNMSTIERFERAFQVFMNCVFTEANYPHTEDPVWRVLYDHVKYLHSQLSGADLGALSTIFSVEVYRNFALGLESVLGDLERRWFDPPVDFGRVGGMKF
jgi:hypothetical protein